MTLREGEAGAVKTEPVIRAAAKTLLKQAISVIMTDKYLYYLQRRQKENENDISCGRMLLGRSEIF